MRKEIIECWNGSIIELLFSANGNRLCPVCGEESLDSGWRPYDEFGYLSYEVCSCGLKYGFNDDKVPPSNRLEKLGGTLSEFYSIRINKQWRIMFIWNNGNASKVEIIDYH